MCIRDSYKMANQAVMKSGVYAYTGRKLKKRDFRQLWITRINAACKMNGMNYSTFVNGLKTVSYTHLPPAATMWITPPLPSTACSAPTCPLTPPRPSPSIR